MGSKSSSEEFTGDTQKPAGKSTAKKCKKGKKKSKYQLSEGLNLANFEYDHTKSISEYFEVTSNILGIGNYSKVKLGMNRLTEEGVAVKVINRDAIIHRPEMLKNEVNILQQVDHPNIIKLYAMFDCDEDETVFLVMELVTGGELFDRIIEIQQYTELEARDLMHQLLSAIAYLHERGIAHRDLKPENLLLENREPNSQIKIADFGLSRVYRREQLMSTACGTPGYIAPEILQNVKYDKEVDLWSAGVIMYILLCGYPPFYDAEEFRLYEKIMSGRFQFQSPFWDGITKEAKDLIVALLNIDPDKRLTAEEALQSSWLTMDLEQALLDENVTGIHQEFKTQLSHTWPK